jgi:hypothetical protein
LGIGADDVGLQRITAFLRNRISDQLVGGSTLCAVSHLLTVDYSCHALPRVVFNQFHRLNCVCSNTFFKHVFYLFQDKCPALSVFPQQKSTDVPQEPLGAASMRLALPLVTDDITASVAKVTAATGSSASNVSHFARHDNDVKQTDASLRCNRIS